MGLVTFVAAGAVFAPRPARAGDMSVRVTVKRAPDASDCPTAAHLAAAIARSGHREAPSTAPTADARLRFEVEMARSASGFSATVQIMGARIGTRQIEHTGASCEPLENALAVALLVVIDDVEAADQASPPPAPPPEPPAPVEPAERSGPPPLPKPPPDEPRERTELVDQPEERDAVLETLPARTANNSFFIQLGGAGLFYSINFERIFGDSDVSVRFGFGYVHLDGTIFGHLFNEEDITVPGILSYYVGLGGPHKIQIGLGAMLLYQQYDGNGPVATRTTMNFSTVLGYRYLPVDGGINFGISFTPCFEPGTTLPWGGVDFGVGF
ncbi:MAG TPA: hypothetical protein VHV30_04605 [Polyangiaceae bacterium]|nr:hypothetical protein [Polyangiaceae bacterium]